MAAAPLKLHKELEKLFGPDDSPTIQSFYIKQLLRLAWSGKTCSEGLRPICWRVFLGILSNSDKSLWKTQLKQQVSDYAALKERILPSLDKVKVDPLSMFSSGEGQSDEWNSYYKSIELSNFIKGDLDRLYLTGIEEDGYFQTKQRRAALLSILFVWSLQNTSTSYRQGMHEIVGCILFVVECERAEWEKANSRKELSPNFSLCGSFSEATIEAHTYYIFERIMLELQPLYDPVLTRSHGVESQPFVVQFCTKVQEHYLRILDPDLCSLLEESYVQAQLYGLRWSRLMLGREFSVSHDQLFVLWDYMFACSYDAENHTETVSDLMDHDSPTNVYSVLANSRLLGNLKSKNIFLRESAGAAAVGGESKFTYVITPLIGALGDFMLAMLLHIREQLMESDASSVMGFLMHYPEMDSVVPVVECVDMIRRGVILQDGMLSGAMRNALLPSDISQSNGGSASYNKAPPSWLLSSASMHSSGSAQNLSKRMSEKFSQVKSAVGNGINALVDTVIEATSEQNHSDLLSASNGGESGAQQGKARSGSSVGVRRNSHKETQQQQQQQQQSLSVSQPQGDVDPLSGAVIKKTSSSSSPVPVGVPVEDVFVAPTGHGTGYGGILSSTNAPNSSSSISGGGGSSSNSKSTKKSDDNDSLSAPGAKQSSLSAAGGSSGSSLFAPTSWFPSTGGSAVSKQDRKKANRVSGGVDLHTLQSNLKEQQESDRDMLMGSGAGASSSGKSSGSLFGLSSKRNATSGGSSSAMDAAKSSALANNNSVGDRLLDIADQLAHPAYHYGPSLREGKELHYEAELRKETVKRLRALADVIAGLSNIVEYDVKFGNAKLALTPKSASPATIPAASGIDEIVSGCDSLAVSATMEAVSVCVEASAAVDVATSDDDDDTAAAGVLVEG